MENSNAYIQILVDSLQKKITILEELEEQNEIQKEILSKTDFDEDSFQENIANKENLIKQLNELDKGFDLVYNRVQKELVENKELHKDSIRTLQEEISRITELSVNLQTQEARNQTLATNCFSGMHRRVSDVKNTKRVAASYYQSMARTNYVEPQFMDKKK